MNILGVHIVDVVIVLLYLGSLMVIGQILSSRVKGQSDFYLAGRKLGPMMTFFLNFGNMTDANSAASTATAVFKQGVGGVWISLQYLLCTPYYWFMNMWFRRVRLITMGDLFEDRFGGKLLPSLYAGFNVFAAIVGIAVGYLVSYKTIDGLVRTETTPSQTEVAMMADYEEYLSLKSEYAEGNITDIERLERYQLLSELVKSGEVKSHVSAIPQVPFFIIYGLVIGIYVMLGGMSAAVFTDAIQGLLIIFFSLMLIPLGLSKIGGFEGLHLKLPAHAFDLLGSQAASNFTWYSTLAIILVTIVQVNGLPGNMSVGGSARNEFAARIGAVSGGFVKRFMTVAWAFCGLIGLAMFGDSVSDPDLIWGLLSRELLAPGLLGLMLAGILAANMSTLDASALFMSGLFTRNLYMPLFPNRSEKHYIWVGRVVIASGLIAGAIFATTIDNIVDIFLTMLSLNVTFGAPVFLLLKWRRLTKKAVVATVIFSLSTIVFIPNIAPFFPGFRTLDALSLQTEERRTETTRGATANEVETEKASHIGESISVTKVSPPTAVFFDKVVLTDPTNPNSGYRGVGRFHFENYIMHSVGLPMEKYSQAGLLTARFVFDALVPFALLIAISLLTKHSPGENTRRFYAKMQTPVAATPELDEAAVAQSYANPDRYEQDRLFKWTQFEFYKPNKEDCVGFALCCFFVIGIIAFFLWLLGVGR